jgi:hypothetical protein
MKLFLIFALSVLVGCQNFNANTFDKDRYGEFELSGSSGFKASYPILQNRCMNCHYHAQWSELTDEQDWVRENLVVFGDAANSELITRIKNYGAAGSDMPQGGSALPSSEFTTLRQWVQP